MTDPEHSGPAFIPAPILHDDDLSPRAKLLAGRIVNLSRKEGYCWATNRYLADDLGANERTLERWIKEIRDTAHFEFEYERTPEGTSRRIYPVNPARKSAEWGYANNGKPARKSAYQDVEVVKEHKRGRTRPSRRHNGKPSGPGDPNYIGPCPDEGCEGQLKPTPKGPYCSVCAETKEAVA